MMFTWRSYHGVAGTIDQIVEDGYLFYESKEIVCAFKKAYDEIQTHMDDNRVLIFALSEIISARTREAIAANRPDESLKIATKRKF